MNEITYMGVTLKQFIIIMKMIVDKEISFNNAKKLVKAVAKANGY